MIPHNVEEWTPINAAYARGYIAAFYAHAPDPDIALPPFFVYKIEKMLEKYEMSKCGQI